MQKHQYILEDLQETHYRVGEGNIYLSRNKHTYAVWCCSIDLDFLADVLDVATYYLHLFSPSHQTAGFFTH